MDSLLLIFFNQTLAHPLLDIVMVAVTIAGIVFLPILGIALHVSPKHRRIGAGILVSLAAALILTLIFQVLAWRPRPEAVRLLLLQPHFPSYPSGHATTVFAVAFVVGLSYRRAHWWGVSIVGAALIALSRVYLGHHYPSDVLGGAILGASVGAACYGLIVQPRPDWRWLLWPQIALALVITLMAYLGYLPWWLLQWPLADKVIHFLLFGAVVFWLNLWLKGRGMQLLGRRVVPVAILFPLAIATLEEGAQFFSPLRSSDLLDLSSDLLGMLFFYWLSTKFIQPSPSDGPQPRQFG